MDDHDHGGCPELSAFAPGFSDAWASYDQDASSPRASPRSPPALADSVVLLVAGDSRRYIDARHKLQVQTGVRTSTWDVDANTGDGADSIRALQGGDPGPCH